MRVLEPCLAAHLIPAAFENRDRGKFFHLPRADIADAIIVAVFLAGVGNGGAVVLFVADAVFILIILPFAFAKVAVIAKAVIITVGRAGAADAPGAAIGIGRAGKPDLLSRKTGGVFGSRLKRGKQNKAQQENQYGFCGLFVHTTPSLKINYLFCKGCPINKKKQCLINSFIMGTKKSRYACEG